ncbi:hypothetical protein A374_16448, partial [Fictibacillus macauensis ZFHKF-1]
TLLKEMSNSVKKYNKEIPVNSSDEASNAGKQLYTFINRTSHKKEVEMNVDYLKEEKRQLHVIEKKYKTLYHHLNEKKDSMELVDQVNEYIEGIKIVENSLDDLEKTTYSRKELKTLFNTYFTHLNGLSKTAIRINEEINHFKK